MLHGLSSWEGYIWCGMLFIMGPVLILLNNYILNTVGYKFPIFLSSLGIIGVAVLSKLAHAFGWIKIDNKSDALNCPRFWWTKVLPIGLVSAGAIATGNSVYLHLSVSFTQILKALTPVYILICLVMFRVEVPSMMVVSSVCVISFGTIVASFGEVKFSWNGFLLQSLADILEGSRLVMLQTFITQHNGTKLTPMESMYLLSPATAVCQLLIVFVYERNAIFENKSWALMQSNWYLFLIALTAGVCINITGVYVIKHTSGLMLKLIGIVRNNFLVIVSVLFFGDHTTMLQMVGYIVSVCGFIWYTRLSHGGKSTSDRTRSSKDKHSYALLSLDEEEMREVLVEHR